MTDTVLRVGLVHGGRVLDERLVRAGDVTVGTDATCTFVLPSGDRAPRCRQIVAWPARRGPRLTAQGLTGRLAAGDSPLELPTEAAGFALTPTHRGKLVVGDSVVLFQCLAAKDVAPLRVAAPASLRRGRVRSRLDWPLMQALIVSAVLLGGSGGGLAAWWHDTGRYFDDLLHAERQGEQLAVAEVAARVVIREAPKPPEPTSAPDATPAPPDPADVVAAAPPTPQPAARRHTPTTRVSKRAPTAGSVRGKTFLTVLGRPDATGTVAGLTAANHYAGAFDDTDGGVVVASRDAAAPAAATPQRETPTDRYVQVCADGACTGAPLPTRQVVTRAKDDRDEAPPIKLRPGSVEQPTGTGTVAKAEIEAVFRRRKGAITYCYERYLQGHPAQNGVVKIRFTLGTAGRVTDIATLNNSFGDPAIGQCITDKVRSWRFPTPKGGSVTFAYPFVLETH